MENYIMINGAKLELTPEQVAALTAAKQEDPFERVMEKDYYYIDLDGEIGIYTDGDDEQDLACYNAGNYCRNEEIMIQRALHETLDRLLWRYSEQHGGDPEWDGGNGHWSIYKATGDGTWKAFCNTTRHCSNSYFCSEKVALAAIDDIAKPFCEAHPEFVW